MSRILVIGGTGNVGRQVVSQLTAAGARFRAMTRNPDAAGLPPQVEVVRGDLTVPETLDRCLEDVDTVFLVWVAPPAAAPGALERIANHARRIVFLTAPLKTPHPFFQQPNPSRDMAERIERLIETSGLEWTFLRAGMFAGNARHFWGPQIRTGDVVRWPYLDAPTAPTDERDLAAVAVQHVVRRWARRRGVCCDRATIADAGRAGAHHRTRNRTVTARRRDAPDEARSELLPVLGSPTLVNTLLQAWAAAIGQPAFVTSTCCGCHRSSATDLPRMGH